MVNHTRFYFRPLPIKKDFSENGTPARGKIEKSRKKFTALRACGNCDSDNVSYWKQSVETSVSCKNSDVHGFQASFDDSDFEFRNAARDFCHRPQSAVCRSLAATSSQPILLRKSKLSHQTWKQLETPQQQEREWLINQYVKENCCNTNHILECLGKEIRYVKRASHFQFIPFLVFKEYERSVSKVVGCETNMNDVKMMFLQISRQVADLHNCNVVHNMLIPDNIVCSSGIHCLITNFSKAIITKHSDKVRDRDLLLPPVSNELQDAWVVPELSGTTFLFDMYRRCSRRSKISSDPDLDLDVGLPEFTALHEQKQSFPFPNSSTDVYQLGNLFKYLINRVRPQTDYGNPSLRDEMSEIRRRYRTKVKKKTLFNITASIKLAKDELREMEVNVAKEKCDHVLNYFDANDFIFSCTKKKDSSRLSSSKLHTHPVFWNINDKVSLMRIVKVFISKFSDVLVDSDFNFNKNELNHSLHSIAWFNNTYNWCCRVPEWIDDLIKRAGLKTRIYFGPSVTDLIIIFLQTFDSFSDGTPPSIASSAEEFGCDFFNIRFPSLLNCLLRVLESDIPKLLEFTTLRGLCLPEIVKDYLVLLSSTTSNSNQQIDTNS